MSSVIPPGTFQVSTDQVTVPGNSAASPRPPLIRRPDSSLEPIRFDAADSHAPHPRATQLSQYTSWLKQKLAAASTESGLPQNEGIEAVAGESDNTGSGTRINNTSYRVDPVSSSPLNRSISNPHFDTRHYVPPESHSTIPAAIPTDGFDPVIEIRETIQRLKEDGRIIGDLEQPPAEPQLNSAVPSFRWPAVTTSLVGSPAMLNLELHVQNAISEHRNQVVVTSTTDGVGGSTIAMALARQAATHGSRVLLIDANIANPSIARTLGLTGQISWLQAISERRLPNELVIKQKCTPVAIMPLHQALPRVHWPRKIYDQFSRIANPIAWDYDLVIVDAGPVSQLIAESTSPKMQAAITLLVSGAAPEKDPDLQRAQSGLLSFGIKQLLLVQNFSQIRSTCAQAG